MGDDTPIPQRLRARSTLKFADRYRCTNCGAPLDFADYAMYTCTDPECGDEWAPETISNPESAAPGTILVGAGDSVTFRHGRGHLTGVVAKVNRRSIVTHHPAAVLATRTVAPERVVSVTFAQPESEED